MMVGFRQVIYVQVAFVINSNLLHTYNNANLQQCNEVGGYGRQKSTVLATIGLMQAHLIIKVTHREHPECTAEWGH